MVLVSKPPYVYSAVPCETYRQSKTSCRTLEYTEKCSLVKDNEDAVSLEFKRNPVGFPEQSMKLWV